MADLGVRIKVLGDNLAERGQLTKDGIQIPLFGGISRLLELLGVKGKHLLRGIPSIGQI
jgi:hypothetical protein